MNTLTRTPILTDTVSANNLKDWLETQAQPPRKFTGVCSYEF